MNIHMNYFAPVVLAALLHLPATAIAEAGKIQFVYGNVQIIAEDGKFRYAKKGQQVNEGETISTDAESSAQVKMADGGVLAVRPETRLKIEQFDYRQKDEDRSFFGLLRGSFRSITGWIGKRNKKGFRVSTPTATIGIRGSDADIGFDPATQLTGVRTYTGSHVLTAPDENGVQVSLVTNPGDIGVHIPGAAPRLGEFFPFATPAPRQSGQRNQISQSEAKNSTSRAENKPKQQQGVSQQGRRNIVNSPLNNGDTQLSGQSTALLNPPNIINELNSSEVIEPAKTQPVSGQRLLPDGSVVIGSDIWEDSIDPTKPSFVNIGNGGTTVDTSIHKVVIDGGGALVELTDNAGTGSYSFRANTGVLTDHAGFVIEDTVTGNTVSEGDWGIWQNNSAGQIEIIDFGSQKDVLGGFGYVYGSNATTKNQLVDLGHASVTNFTYQHKNGRAVNEVGALSSAFVVKAYGTFQPDSTLGSITIDLDKADFAKGSTNWSGTFTGKIDELMSGPVSSTNGSCNKCAPVHGEASGKFVGNKAQGLLVGLGFTDGVHAVSGVSVLKKQ